MSRTTVIPLWLWLSIAFLVVTCVVLGQVFLVHKSKIKTNWELNRLKSLKHNGVIVIGTSLVKCGFYFDTEFEKIAKEKGLDITFVRMTKSSGTPQEFKRPLLAILKSHPKYLFIQIEPFMLENNPDYQWIIDLQIAIHHLLVNQLNTHNYLLKKMINKEPQSDSDALLHLDKIASWKDINTKRIILKKPHLSSYYVEFLKKAKEENIQLIFLEMNRSEQAYKVFIPKNTKNLITRWIKNFKASYRVRIWHFSGLDMRFYSDRAHLNKDGRKLFSYWFIQKLKKEQSYV